MLLITVGRYFPKILGNEQIYCPHEQCVRTGENTRYTVMIGLFFIPLLPAATVKDWRCSSCAKRVSPNEGGKASKKVLIFNSVVAIGGFIMFALFAFGACYIGGKNSAFNPESIGAARGFLGFFAFLGLLIVAKALFEARKIAQTLSVIVSLDPERIAAMQSILEPGDDARRIQSKLSQGKFTDAEIQTYLQSWVVPVS